MRCKIVIALLLLVSCNKKEKFENVQLIGHAGSGLYSSTAPYHADSYEAVEYAAELEGISGVEVDVQLSASNTAWLFHDEQLPIFDCLRDRHGRIVALIVGRVTAQYATEDTSFLVLGDGSLRRRTEAGDSVKTLAICGNLRLCVSRKAEDAR